MNLQPLHRDAIVIDGLVISNRSRSVFEDMQRGGLTAANCTCSVWEDSAPLHVYPAVQSADLPRDMTH